MLLQANIGLRSLICMLDLAGHRCFLGLNVLQPGFASFYGQLAGFYGQFYGLSSALLRVPTRQL